MDIYPQDLGRKDYVRILRLRTRPPATAASDVLSAPVVPAPARLTPLRRLWIRGADEEDARYAEPVFDLEKSTIPALLAIELPFFLIGLFALFAKSFVAGAIIFGLIALCSYLFGIMLPQRNYQEKHQKLSEGEAARLIHHTPDSLASQYLQLVLMAMTLPAAMTGQAAKNLREALHALGNAIDDLPAQNPKTMADGPDALKIEAARLTVDARAESDPVIAASLERRAAAALRQAETVARAEIILRRNLALRLEIADQMDALRTSLRASSLSRGQDSADLAELAGSIQRVATEASAVTAARAEVDAALSGRDGESELRAQSLSLP